MNHSPGLIRIIIHYHCSLGDVDNIDSPFAKEVIPYLIENDILKVSTAPDSKYEANREATNAYLDALTKVPLPVKRFVVEGSIKTKYNGSNK